MMNDLIKIPFFGVIEDVKDPLENGRYRVRVYNYNTQDKSILPTDMLKWFPISVSNSAGSNGLGWSPTGLKLGSFVEGYFIDENKQTGIITGSLTGSPFGFNDVNGLALTSNNALRNPYQAPDPEVASEKGDQPTIDPTTNQEVDTDKPVPIEDKADQISEEQRAKEEQLKKEKEAEAEANKSEEQKEYEKKQQEELAKEEEETYVVPPKTKADYEKLLTNRKIQVFLDLIMYTEGTSRYPNPYKVMFTGKTFDSFASHPNIVNKGGGYSSTAAGAFQFLYKTWSSHARVLGLEDFGPQNQRIAALYEGRAAIAHILNCEWEQAIKSVNTKWASLPGSPYGQPTKSMDACLSFINNRGGFTCDGVKYEPGPDTPLEDRIMTNGVKGAMGETLNFPSMNYQSGGSVYPYNQVFVTEAGHYMEFDSTPGRERVKIFHAKETYDEMLPDGSIMHKVSGNRYEINLADSTMVVHGDLNMAVDGQIKMSGGAGVIITAPNIVLNSETVYSSGIHYANDFNAGGVSLGTHNHPGVIRGGQRTDSPSPYNPDLEVISVSSGPMIAESIPAKSPEERLAEGSMTQEQYEQAKQAEQTEPAELAENNIEPIEVECGEIPMNENGAIDYDANITPNVKLKELSIAAHAGSHKIVDNVGLSKSQIICNLKALSENVIEKVRARETIQINSGFRAQSGSSQHNRGQAVDIRIVGKAADQDAHYELAKWIAENCVFDQLILEKQNGRYWVHVSYNSGGKNRKDVRSVWVNHTKYLPGLRKL